MVPYIAQHEEKTVIIRVMYGRRNIDAQPKQTNFPKTKPIPTVQMRL